MRAYERGPVLHEGMERRRVALPAQSRHEVEEVRREEARSVEVLAST